MIAFNESAVQDINIRDVSALNIPTVSNKSQVNILTGTMDFFSQGNNSNNIQNSCKSNSTSSFRNIDENFPFNENNLQYKMFSEKKIDYTTIRNVSSNIQNQFAYPACQVSFMFPKYILGINNICSLDLNSQEAKECYAEFRVKVPAPWGGEVDWCQPITKRFQDMSTLVGRFVFTIPVPFEERCAPEIYIYGPCNDCCTYIGTAINPNDFFKKRAVWKCTTRNYIIFNQNENIELYTNQFLYDNCIICGKKDDFFDKKNIPSGLI